MAKTTIIDIARAAGVSFKTVSRVINREPRVSPETRERVEAAIARLDYKPNVWARTLRSSHSHLVALICCDAGHAYVNQMQVAAMTACQQRGYHLLVERLRPDHRAFKQRIREVLSSVQLDGVLLVPPMSDNDVILEALKAAKLPFVRVSPHEQLDVSSYVHMDNQRAAYEMTCYLLDLGHRDIAFIAGPATQGAAKERLSGFEEAMKQHNGNLRPEWITSGQFTVRSGMAAGEKLLTGRQRPTAIFAGNDDMAIGVMSAAYREGLVLPRDLSIAGFDDIPFSSSLWPGLTTVRQPVTRLAMVATEMLIGQIEAPGLRRVRQLEFKIVERESTAPLGKPA